MTITIPALDLHFLDYAVLALLLLVMHGITSIEYIMRSSGKKMLRVTRKSDYQAAATWAFIGMILTLLTGLIVEGAGETPYTIPGILVPLVFIGRWMVFQRKATDSDTLNFELVKEKMDAEYEGAIITYVTENKGVTVDQIYDNCKGSLQIPRLLTDAVKKLKISNTLFSLDALGDVWEELVFTQERASVLLAQLVKDGKLIEEGGVYRIDRK